MNSELMELAELALRMAKADLERDGTVTTPVAVVRRADGSPHQLPLPPNIGAVMNSGRGKELLFSLVRVMVARFGYTAVMFATEAWIGQGTAKMAALSREEQARLMKQGVRQLAEQGYVDQRECVLVTVQTAETVLTLTEPFTRDEEARQIHYGERRVKEFPQANFHGRQKMYGEFDSQLGDIEDPYAVLEENLQRMRQQGTAGSSG